MQRTSSTPARLSRRALLGATLAAGAATATGPTFARAARSAAGAPAPPVIGGDPSGLFQELGNVVARRMVELRIPGVALGVIADGQEYTAGFGVTNVDLPLPVDADTLFQIGSTTKTYTATTIMRLVEQGKLDLEAPVQTYLPDFRIADPGASAAVRLRHLVTHTGGWYDNALEQETGDGDDALARFVAGMADLPQITPPGKYFSYNNSAVSLAGRVIEAVTGQTYEAAVAEFVLRPLGLEGASFFPEQIMTKAFTVGHDVRLGKPVVLEPWALPRLANPAGGLIASLNDELRYARFHLGDGTANGARVLSAESMRRMQTPLGPSATLPTMGAPIEAVGVNWMLWHRGGVRIVSHDGGTNGQQSTFSLVPARGFAVTVLTNVTAGVLLDAEVTNWALDRFLGLRQPPVTATPVDQARLAEYAGEYVSPDGSQTIRVREENGALQLEGVVPGLGKIASPLRVVGDDLATLEFMGLTVFIDFVRDDAGKVAWIRFVGRLVPRAA